ncbi:hypothetical protein ACFL2H_08570 [Planctomycetota bacterium]
MSHLKFSICTAIAACISLPVIAEETAPPAKRLALSVTITCWLLAASLPTDGS